MTRYTLHDKRHDVSLNPSLLTVACFAHLCRFFKKYYFLLFIITIIIITNIKTTIIVMKRYCHGSVVSFWF